MGGIYYFCRMAFPKDFIPPLCDVFVERLDKLLQRQYQPSLFPKIDYCLVTLNLLIERNETALQYLGTRLLVEKDNLLCHFLDFLIHSKEGITDKSSQVKEKLCTLIKTAVMTNRPVRFLNSSMLQLISSKISGKIYKPVGDLIVQLIINHSELIQEDTATQLQVKDFLEHLLQLVSLEPNLGLKVKSLLIQLASNHNQPLTDSVHVTENEVEYVKTLICSSGIAVKETLELLSHLVNDSRNRSLFLDHGILDVLGDLMEGETTEIAAQLISKLLEEDQSLSLPSVSHTNCVLDCKVVMPTSCQGIISDVKTTDHGAIKLVEKLFPCVAISFEQFRAHIERNDQREASTHLMYASTLVQLINGVLAQEDDAVIASIADSIAVMEGLPHTIVMMLWASAVLMPYGTDTPPPHMHSLWIKTFFDIQSCIVQWTGLSLSFCQALINNGLIHFFESELEKFIKQAMSVTNEFVFTHMTSILTIIYNSIQKPACVQRFQHVKSFENNFINLMVSLQSFELRFMCKLCLGYLLPVLHDNVRGLLEFSPEEVSFIMSSLHEAISSPYYTSNTGFSANELLDSIHGVVDVSNNLLVLVGEGLLDVLRETLNHSILQEITLLFIWSILSSTVVSETLWSHQSLIAKITSMTPHDKDVVMLHHCVVFLMNKDTSCTEKHLSYAQGCFKYRKYQECIDACTQLVRKSDSSITQEAKILKGKSLYYAYQGDQLVYLRNRSTAPPKEIEPMKAKLYRMTKECILILGAASDVGLLDNETSELLDRAMIDYVRETNNLKECKRCILCRCKKNLRRSHIIPKSILKEIAVDLMTDDEDHKVFLPIIGKSVKKSAGEATFWLLCGDCEERLCQNGENQFSEQVYQMVCPNKSILHSDVRIRYGRWLYDFSIGLLFRTLAICHQFKTMQPNYDLYKLFALCRHHLLSMTPLRQSSYQLEEGKSVSGLTTVNEGSEEVVSCDLASSIRVFFFVNPTINSCPSTSRLQHTLKLPGLFMSSLDLEDGTYQHNNQRSFFCAHFDSFNILIQFEDSPYCPFNSTAAVHPYGGEITIPDEYNRWKQVPTGVWQVLNGFTQARRIQSKQTSTGLYSSDKNILLDDSVLVNCLPKKFQVSLVDKLPLVSLPCDLIVLAKKTSHWGINQSCTYQLVSDKIQSFYQVIFELAVPGIIIIDGVLLDPIVSCFCNKKTDLHHPIKLNVVEMFLEEDFDITNILNVLTKLN